VYIHRLAGLVAVVPRHTDLPQAYAREAVRTLDALIAWDRAQGEECPPDADD